MVKRRNLNRSVVVLKAVELADSTGDLNTVTLTSLAKALNIKVPSLYNHLDNLDDLHQALAAFGLEVLIDQIQREISGKTGREALLSIADAYRRFALKHPGIYPLIVRAPDPGNLELERLAQKLLQLLLLVLASYGLQGEDALHAVRGYRAVIHGFSSLEALGGFKMALDNEVSYRRMLTTYLNGLRPESA